MNKSSNGRESNDETVPARWQTVFRWGAPALTLAAIAWIGLGAIFNPNVRFLSPGPGKWIVYPTPPHLRAYPGIKLFGTFRRAFNLTEKPATALFSWRCMTNAILYVNSSLVPISDPGSGNWKTTSQMDVAPYLRQGTNVIAISVVNQSGPPALSARLKAGDFSLVTDETWESSIFGSIWKPAQAAYVVPAPGKGNVLALMETTKGAFWRCWPWLGLFAVISAGAVALLQFYLGRAAPSRLATVFPKVILLVVASVWILLFLHNFPVTPADAGFDATPHLDYVRYIQDYKMLPSAFEGWEMFQAPLYYIISAGLLGLSHCQVTDYSGLTILRLFSVAIGTATLAFVYIGLRLIFPGDWKKPLTGVVFGAFVPAQIYLLHYTTNETLSAMFVTAALCVGLYLLRTGEAKWGWYAILGIVLGLGLCTKASAALAAPAIMGVLTLKLLMRREQKPQAWLRAIAGPLIICLMIGGWHYLKLWQEYGNPFTGNWNSQIGAPWWQYKGLQTSGYYFSFGESLIRPFCSGLHSFWDGFYSTLWGDGLLGGKSDVWGRPPWNYDFMAVGYVLALAPTFLVLTGSIRAAAGCYRALNLPWLLLLGVGWLYVFAIVGMSFKVPSYAQIKAFYGLPVLLPFCALGALGFEYWAGRGKLAGSVLGVATGLWLINVYASFWIRPDTIQTALSCAISSSCLKEDPSGALLKILERDPGDSRAAICLALLENSTLATEHLEQALKYNYSDGPLENETAQVLQLGPRLNEAIAHAKRAIELAPADEDCYETLCLLDVRKKDYAGAITAGQQALSLDPTDLQSHFYLGVALMNTQQFQEAAWHFQAIVDYQAGWAEAEFCLGRCLIHDAGQRAEGLDYLQEAVRLDPANAVWQSTLQKALQGH